MSVSDDHFLKVLHGKVSFIFVYLVRKLRARILIEAAVFFRANVIAIFHHFRLSQWQHQARRIVSLQWRINVQQRPVLKRWVDDVVTNILFVLVLRIILRPYSSVFTFTFLMLNLLVLFCFILLFLHAFFFTSSTFSSIFLLFYPLPPPSHLIDYSLFSLLQSVPKTVSVS